MLQRENDECWETHGSDNHTKQQEDAVLQDSNTLRMIGGKKNDEDMSSWSVLT